MIVEIMSDGAVARIETKGAELQSLRDIFGTEYLWQADPKIWPKHSPVLFPVVGRLKDGKYTYEGKEYEMDLHGFAHNYDFAVIAQEKSRVDLMIKTTEDTLKQYPFHFQFIVSFELNGASLTVGYTVKNTGDNDMLFCAGAHPGFNVPLVEGDRFEDYDLVFEKEEDLFARLVDENVHFTLETKQLLNHERVLPMSHELFDHDAVVPVKLNSTTAELKSRRTGRGVSFNFEGYKTLAFWSKKGPSPFICLEPWIGMGCEAYKGSELKDKIDIQTLAPQKTFKVAYTVGLL
jgi:galactose mutarotase-like enzyme